MKIKNILLGALILLSISIFAKDVSITKAKQIAKNFFYENINQISKVDYKDITFSEYYTELSGNTSMYYIFNRENTPGFIIISGDDALPPVLGYSFKRPFEINNLAPVVADILANYKKQQEIVKNNKYTAKKEVAKMWSDLEYTEAAKSINEILTVDALTLVEWNQGSFYNALCPEDAAGPSGHVYVGCVAVAMAQAMKYFDYPLHGTSSHSYNHSGFWYDYDYGTLSANYGTSTYNWNNMPYSLIADNFEVAQLSYHCAVAVNMSFSPDGSGSQTEYIETGLENYFKYSTAMSVKSKSNYSDTNWEALLRDQLDQNLPMVYTGSGTTVGHAWNCDGYQGTNYFRMNWGWGGSNNGFFYLDDMYAPANPGEDPQSLMQGQKAIINIYPASGYPEYCSVTKEIGGEIGNFKDGSGNLDYQNNQNCKYLIAPTCGNYITVNFETFDVDASDYISIYDGETTNDNLLASFYGDEVPTSVQSTGNKLLINFVTDGSGTATGWVATFDVKYCISDAVIESPSGVIGDGSSSCDYHQSYCTWTVQPPGATNITFDFTEFEVGDAIDYLSIYQDGITGSLVQKLRLSNLPTAPITVNSGVATLRFFTNTTGHASGWSANYTSSTTKVNLLETQKAEVTIFPNPFIGDTKISYTLFAKSNVEISLTNIIGETLGKTVIMSNIGENSIKLSELQKDITRGIYFINIKTNNQSITKRVVCM